MQGDSLGGAPTDTIRIYENLQIGANIIFTNLCDNNDSASAVTQIYGGTPPYSTLWSNGDTARNTSGLLQNTLTPSLPSLIKIIVSQTLYCCPNCQCNEYSYE